MLLNWFSLIVLLGAVQGLITALVLLASKNQDNGKSRILAVLLLVLSYNGFETAAWNTGFSSHYVFFQLFSYTTIFALGPAVLLFARLQHGAVHNFRHHFYFTGFLLGVRVFHLIYYFLAMRNIVPVIPFEQIEDWRWFILEPLSGIVFCAYVVVAWREVKRLGLLSANKELGFLLLFMLALSFVWLGTIAAQRLFNMNSSIRFYPLESLFVVLIYWLGFIGLKQTRIIYQKHSASPSLVERLSETEITGCVEAIEKALKKDKLFLDPDLTVAKLAAAIGFPVKTVSTVLNQKLGKSFATYINEHRLQEFELRCFSADWKITTITGLARDCGFSSPATFQRFFSQSTGMTPSDYIKTVV